MNWRDAIKKFEERRLAIWDKMPQDVYNLSQGIVPGDTNVYGQLLPQCFTRTLKCVPWEMKSCFI